MHTGLEESAHLLQRSPGPVTPQLQYLMTMHVMHKSPSGGTCRAEVKALAPAYLAPYQTATVASLRNA